MSFLVSAIIAGSFVPVSDSSASTVTVDYRNTGYFVTVTSPDTVSLSVDATPTGQSMMSSASNVNVVTNAPNGYKLYISAIDDHLTSSDTSITQSFSPVTTTSLTANTWGYSLDTTGTTTSDKSWYPVPAVSSPGTMEESELITAGATDITPTGADIPNYPGGTDISVFYGINSTTDMPSGTYTTTVTYTAFGEGIPSDTMQEFTMAECNNMANDEQKVLRDSRNNREYTIVKARDGNCWMADNLWLYNIDNPSQPLTVSSLDSDFGSSTTETTFTIPATSNWSTNITSESKLHVATNSGYTGEPYYNWFLATAGSTASSGTVSTSICPRGWRLPISGDKYQNKSYAKLLDSYSITTGAGLLAQTSLGFTKYYGDWYIGSGSESDQGSGGVFWTANADSSSNALRFYYVGSQINTQHSLSKGNGFSVRCVLNGTEEEQMQNFTLTDCANMSTDETKKLYDRRNGQQYGIIKARDGNCWMTDNLNIVNMTVSAADSDFTSGTFTIPASSDWTNNEYSAAKVHTSTTSGNDGEKWYNYCSAVAKNSCPDTTSPETSICPKNWKLPVSNGTASLNYSFQKLMASYNYTQGSQFVNSTNLLGFTRYYGEWDYATPPHEFHIGINSYYWATTPYSASQVYTYIMHASGLWDSPTYPKGYGQSIRCVVRN